MLKKMNINANKISLNAYYLLSFLVLLNGCVAHIKSLADPFTQAVIMVIIPYIYYSIMNTLMHENFMRISKSNAWGGKYWVVMGVLTTLSLFYASFPNLNQISIMDFINNNQLTYHFGLLLVSFNCIYILIILIINLKRFGKEEQH